MKLFIDTASVEEIKSAMDLGLIDGVTTNPSLVAKSKRNHEELIKEICELINKPVSAEVLSVKADEMFEEALKLSKIHEKVVIKIPLISEGLKVVKRLSEKNIPTNVTLGFSSNQALAAAKAGATYVSIFMGRLDDIGHNGTEIVAECHEVLRQYGFATEVLAASVRHPFHVLEMARRGVPVCTVPYKVLNQMLQHPLTHIGLEKFLADAKKSQ